MTVAEMTNTVHPRAAVRKAMAMLQAFFDEAGTSSVASGTFAVCGYVAPQSEWEKFEARWDKLLQRPCFYPVDTRNVQSVCRPLEYLHAVEMEGLGKKRFRRIGQKNRDHLIQSSVTTIVTSGLIGVGWVISLDAYSALDDRSKEVVGDPYLVCLQSVIVEAARQSVMFLGEDPKESIAYIFERNPLWEIPLHNMYKRLLDEGYGPRYRMGSLTFGEKKEFVPLQAADRLCYETYQHHSENEERPQLKRLLDWPQHHGRQLDHDGLPQLIEELKRSRRL